MNTPRRQFLRSLAAASAALPAARLAAAAPVPTRSDSAPSYGYLGRTPGYREWQVVEPGRTLAQIESFVKGSFGLVRVTTNDGRTGWGQLAPFDPNISALVLHQKVAPHVLGRDISAIDALNDRVIDANMKAPWSYTCRALAGVDTALWDLYGQLTGKPVYALLGGTAKPIPVYGSSQRRDISPADEATRLVKLRDQDGYRAFKIRLGVPTGHNGDAAPGRTEQIIPVVRRALGDKIVLKADANSCYTPDRAIAIGRRLEEHHYEHYEEPCPYWELEWTREVTAALAIPVAGGEQDNDLAQWRRMIALQAVDIFQPDLCYVGGLTRAWRVAQLAHAAGRPVVPHAANLSMVTLFTMHYLAAVPNSGGWLEFSIETEAALNQQARAMFSPALTVQDGNVRLSGEPGWGVRVNDAWLAAAERQVSRRPA